MLFACDFCCDFVIFVCDFFVISRKVYEKKSVICPSRKTLDRRSTRNRMCDAFSWYWVRFQVESHCLKIITRVRRPDKVFPTAEIPSLDTTKLYLLSIDLFQKDCQMPSQVHSKHPLCFKAILFLFLGFFGWQRSFIRSRSFSFELHSQKKKLLADKWSNWTFAH